MKFKRLSILIILALAFQLSGCATTTKAGVTGVERKQLMMFSEKQVESMSLKSYMQTLKTANDKKTLNTDPAVLDRVRKISNRLIAQVGYFRNDAQSWKWEVNVEKNDEVNAYCMPGGKIMVFTGLIDKLKATDDELAAVIGHEISHALREHGRERMSLAAIQNGGIAVLSAILSSSRSGVAGPAVQATAIGSQLFFALPNSRTQETEADRIGLELSARAGFKPEAAVSLWTKMSQQGGKKPPQFMSTHPSNETRLVDLKTQIPKVMPLYDQAIASQSR